MRLLQHFFSILAIWESSTERFLNKIIRIQNDILTRERISDMISEIYLMLVKEWGKIIKIV
jgi:hypothetical protein